VIGGHGWERMTIRDGGRFVQFFDRPARR
jgi:hypothetical protein